MCGISGIYNYRDWSPVDKRSLEEMNSYLVHRGPDDHGYFINRYIGLAHRRLSIIDLITGRQPIRNERDEIQVIFNGEIYNYLALKKELLQKGHRFYTNTDTEVIVHLFEDYGEECFAMLTGMFSIALWDGRDETLYLVRDHLGIKPLYYCETDQGVIFSSELLPIIRTSERKIIIDHTAINQFLRLGYIMSPLSIYKGIYKITPATMLIFNKQGRRVKKFWRPILRHNHRKEEYNIELLGDNIMNAVSSNMISDVPVGAFLSGGVDSSTITYYMSELSELPVKTFSIGFDEDQINEIPFAREVAKACNTDHNELIVKADAISILDDLCRYFGEPFADPAALPTYYLCKMTKKYVKVALSGDGGDELFAGYNKYISHKLSEIYVLLPKVIRKHIIEEIFKLAARYISDPILRDRLTWIIKVLRDADNSPIERYLTKASIFRDKHLCDLMTVNYMSGEGLFNDMITDIMNQKYDNFIDTMLYADQRYALPERMLTKIDRISMAFSLEVRVPFLNNDFVEFVNGMKRKMKIMGFSRKRALKKVMINRLPKIILNRKKQGFEIPLTSWFKGEMGSYAKAVLSENNLRLHELFNNSEIMNLIESNKTVTSENSRMIYNLIMFQRWYEVCYA